MADINKLKDKIKSTIYPNGKGAINASDHQAMLLDMADGMAETDTKLATLSKSVGSAFVYQGKLFDLDYSRYSDSANHDATDYLKVGKRIKGRMFLGSPTYPTYNITFLDKDKKVISSYVGGEKEGLQDFDLIDEIPNNAVYYVASNYNAYREESYILFDGYAYAPSIEKNEQTAEKVNVLEDDVATIKEDLIYANPLAGLVFGNLADDATIKNIVKSVYIEIIDESIILPDKLGFFLIRNSDAYSSNQCIIQFCEFGKTDVLFSYVAANKVTSLTSINVPGFGQYADKVNLRLTCDFSDNKNINFGYLVNNSYLQVNKLNHTEITEMVTLTGAIQDLQEQVESLNKEDALYSDGCQGIQWGRAEGDVKMKMVIKSFWLKYLDPSLELPSNLKFSAFKNISAGSLTDFWIQMTDLSGNVVLQKYIGEKQAGVKQYRLEGYSTYADRIQAFVECDFANNAEDFNFSASKLNTIITTAEVNSRKVESLTIEEGLKEVKNVFEGKTIVCFGDSLTYQTGNDDLQYTDYIHQYTNANVINVGIGGTQLRQRTIPKLAPTSITEGWAGLDIINMIKAAADISFDGSNSYRKVVENAAIYIDAQNQARPLFFVRRLLSIDWSKVDVVTIFAGTNDWANGSNMRGESGSNDENTTLGAINEIIRILLTAYPHIKLYWFTPIVRWQASSLADRTIDKWGDNYVINNFTLKQLSSAIEMEVKNNHIPVCDMYNTLGWNMHNFSQYFNDNDGVHPGKGYKEIALKFISFIQSNRTF